MLHFGKNGVFLNIITTIMKPTWFGKYKHNNIKICYMWVPLSL